MSQNITYNETSSADYSPQDARKRTTWSDIYKPAPRPKTGLGLYRLLAPSAGVRVSPLCLGSMSLGDQWTGYMGGKSVDQKHSEELLDAFVQAGGQFIDTACNYQFEQTEHVIGEWMEKRGNRDDLVISTKYTCFTKARPDVKYPGNTINYGGNHSKNLRISVQGSLRKLRTDYIDLLYVHFWDHSTSIPEVMQSLNQLVMSGKVLYIGVSDTPAWIVSQANEYARQNGIAQFAVYQGNWSLALRDMERDIIPMCRNNGMSIAPYGVLGQGKFKPADALKGGSFRGGVPPTQAQLKVVEALHEVAKEIGDDVQLAQVGLAWCRQMYPDCSPIIGGTSVSTLQSNIRALDIVLSPAQMERLDEASPFNPGFPTAIFGLDPRALPNHESNSALATQAGHIKFTGYPQP